MPPAGTALPSIRPSPDMPELPEVETVRRGLQPVLEGARIVAVETRRPDLRFPFPERFAETPDRAARHRARPARQIPDRASRGRPRPHLPSRHVRLVPDRRGGGVQRRPALFHHERSKLAAHDHVVFTVEAARRPAGPHHLQRPAAVRLHAACRRARARPASDACRARHRADRQRAERRLDRRPVPRPRDAAEIGAARPAADRRHRQYICVRGDVAGEAVAAPRRGFDRRPARQATRRGPIGSPRRCDRSSPRRSRPAARRCATTSRPTARSAISSTASRSTTARASRARAATAAASSRASCRPAARPSIARSASDELEPCADISARGSRHGLRNDHRRNARQGRPDHAQPAEGAQRAQLAGALRTGRGARRLRRRRRRSARSWSPAPKRRSPPAPTSRKCSTRPMSRPSSETSSPAGTMSAACASRSSPLSQAMRWAAVANSP